MGWTRRVGSLFLSPQEEQCCVTGVPVACAALGPDGVSSSALWRKLGCGSPLGPSLWALGLGCGLWLPLVLDSRIQAEQLSRELWVSSWAVLLCPLRTRIVQSFANNCEKNKIFDSPYVTCVIEPSSCRNPLPIQVEEMEVWSGLVWSSVSENRPWLPPDRHPSRVVDESASE